MRRLQMHILYTLSLCIILFYFTGCQNREADFKAPAYQQDAKKDYEEKDDRAEEVVPSSAPITEERIYYDFESDLNGWEIPMWARGKSDYVATHVMNSKEEASHGNGSMKVMASFPGSIWTAALVEIQQYLNLSPYRVVSADIYLPPEAPIGLKAKVILTVGNNWKFVEMSRSVPLIPGEWTTITANIERGSYDWKRIVPDAEFAEDVRKIAIRVESNRKPEYSGALYIDKIRCGK